MLRGDNEVETEAARQAHYIFWCSLIGVPDPCGASFGYQHIVTIYDKYVMYKINYYNKDMLRSFTLPGYATAANTLFHLQGFKEPTDLSNTNDMAVSS